MCASSQCMEGSTQSISSLQFRHFKCVYTPTQFFRSQLFFLNFWRFFTTFSMSMVIVNQIKKLKSGIFSCNAQLCFHRLEPIAVETRAVHMSLNHIPMHLLSYASYSMQPYNEETKKTRSMLPQSSYHSKYSFESPFRLMNMQVIRNAFSSKFYKPYLKTHHERAYSEYPTIPFQIQMYLALTLF